MINRCRLLVAALIVMVVASAARAQQPVPLLIDVDWLAQHLNDRDLVLLHVGDPQQYAAGHIPGARQVAMNDLARQPGGPGDLSLELPDAGMLRAKLEALGVSDDSHIVVYGAADVPSVTRVLFTLDYLGLGAQTSLLNGLMAAWTRAGHPVVTETTAFAAGKLSARATMPVVADAALVQGIRQRATFKLVDARAPIFYDGTQPTMNDMAGHIPAAVSIPFSSVTDAAQVIDRARLEKLFSNAGIKPGDTVVAYCHIGMQATEVLFAARVLGHPVMLYDGSFQDWATRNRGPVER